MKVAISSLFLALLTTCCFGEGPVTILPSSLEQTNFSFTVEPRGGKGTCSFKITVKPRLTKRDGDYVNGRLYVHGSDNTLIASANFGNNSATTNHVFSFLVSAKHLDFSFFRFFLLQKDRLDPTEVYDFPLKPFYDHWAKRPRGHGILPPSGAPSVQSPSSPVNATNALPEK